jgi:predicted nucleotidyltransferase
MLAVLKIVAWSERRTVVPRKDAFDLLLILHNYLDMPPIDDLAG